MSKTKLESCIDLIGSIINRSILDYQSDYIKGSKYSRHIWTDARDFLFEQGRLESFLERFHMLGYINCGYVRDKALGAKLRERYSEEKDEKNT